LSSNWFIEVVVIATISDENVCAVQTLVIVSIICKL